jgi:hypothetical protein
MFFFKIPIYSIMKNNLKYAVIKKTYIIKVTS